jgi:ribosomal protein S18 acetylase RimI-like enzyme
VGPPPAGAAGRGGAAAGARGRGTALLAEANPDADALPGDGRVVRWLGIPGGDGALLACAADTSAVAGVGHLSSIAVHPSARGRGLGRAVTAGVVRLMAEEGCDVVTLGVYAVNAPGTALYDALGAGRHRFTSGRLDVRGRW